MEASVNNKCKAFTSLEQSKKLAGILPLESADMYHFIDDIDKVNKVGFGYRKITADYYSKTKLEYIPCWSLAALLSVLPGGYVIVKNYHSFYYVESRDHSKSTNIFDNPVDACVDMIKQLHKLNLL